MQSIRYVRGSITKNVNFGRLKKEKGKKGGVFGSESYDYDFTLVKPQKRGQLNFGVVRGRGQKVKTEDSHDYQHYDYDSYVWQNESNVFPKTRNNVVDFGKQKSRYSRKEQTHASLM